ncbi:MAG: DUF4115 domain-containing protein, partial [Alphaproteobacteria bacterium]|nr:DUF4115 domain-containing protein [Alphaproteobacteria bacterium]
HYAARNAIVASETLADTTGGDTAPQPSPVAPQPAQTAPNAVPEAQSSNIVVLTATKPAWVRIYDANDKVLLEKEMKATESYTVPADANHPQIRTGAADALSITVGGKAVPQLGDGKHTIKNVEISGSALLARVSAAQPAPIPSTIVTH